MKTTRVTLEKSVLPLVHDAAAREDVKRDFRSRLDWLGELVKRKREMALLKDHLL